MKIHIIQHVAFEPPGMITDWARDMQHTASYSFLFAKNIYWPVNGDYDLLIVLGGPMGVDEESRFGWLKTEKKFIKEAIAAGKTVLGICLGSQLLAEALGSRVYPNAEKEIGFFPVTKTKEGQEDKIFSSLPESWNVFHWHGDTFDLPGGATHIYSSTVCHNQAFRKGKLVGIQFHPEVNSSLLGSMIENERQELIKAPYIQTEEELLAGDITEQNRKYLYYLLTEMTKL